MRIAAIVIFMCLCYFASSTQQYNYDASIDYYAVLGVAKDADTATIRKAYKRLAKRYHPDVNQHSDSSNKFIEVQQAAEILTDDTQRRAYDDDRRYGGGRQRSHHGFSSPHQRSANGYMYRYRGPDGRTYTYYSSEGPSNSRHYDSQQNYNDQAYSAGPPDWMRVALNILSSPLTLLVLLFALIVLASRTNEQTASGHQANDADDASATQCQSEGAESGRHEQAERKQTSQKVQPVEAKLLPDWDMIMFKDDVSGKMPTLHGDTRMVCVQLPRAAEHVAGRCRCAGHQMCETKTAIHFLQQLSNSLPRSRRMVVCDPDAQVNIRLSASALDYLRKLRRRLGKMASPTPADAEACLVIAVFEITPLLTAKSIARAWDASSDDAQNGVREWVETAVAGELAMHDATDMVQAMFGS